jgi:hypothetical protein
MLEHAVWVSGFGATKVGPVHYLTRSIFRIKQFPM